MLDGDKEVDCKHCEGTQSYWNISLDLDLLQTIVNFYPEWFKGCNMSAVAEGRDLKLQNGHKDSSLSAFHEQRQKLVKARIGSILKHKLPKKLGRQTLIQATLEGDTPKSDSIVLSQNSASLEVVKENIFVDAVQAFKSPCNTPSPKMRLGLDDDSDHIFSPTPPYDFNEHSQGSLPSLEASEPSPNLNQGSPCSEITSMSPPSSVCSPMPSLVSPQPLHEQIVAVHMQQNSVPTNKNKKKTKPKTQPKARTIKFHEYKGPPNSKNTSSSSSALPESPPRLNFQQQQLILELQSAFHKHDFRTPPTNDTPIQKFSGDQSGQRNEKQVFNREQPIPASNLEDLKVSDLRAELKKRNLPVSGSKPQLIERLRSHNPSLTQTDINIDSLLLDNSSADTMKELLDALPPSSFETDPCDSLELADVNPITSLSKEEIIVQLQQIYIERLQMDLERSQRQLLECQQPATLTPAPSETSFCQTSLSCENKTKQLIQQLLQQKIQKQEQQKLQANTSVATTSNSTLTALLKSGPLNANVVSPPAVKREISFTDEDDFPGVIPILVNESPTDAAVTPPENKTSSLPNFSALCKAPPPTQFQISRPPPDYNAATRHLQKVKQSEGNPRQPKKHKTSEAVDDVLAVLIASGDLPPSAAEEPPPDIFTSASSLAQSLMDMTPPSSAGLGAASLDFGPLLDLDEMDFGLDDDDTPTLDPTLSISLSQELKATLNYGVNKSSDLINSKTEKGIQSDIMEWLPVQNDSPSTNFQNSAYSLASEGESLFPNTQDALDFLEDDLSVQNDLFFPWGERPDLT